MTSLKMLAKQLLTRGQPVRDYVPVAIAPGGVRHRSTLCWGTRARAGAGPRDQRLDVSDRQWTLGYDPVMVGVALAPALAREIFELQAPDERVRLLVEEVRDGESHACSSLELAPVKVLPEVGVLLFRAERASIRCLDPLRREVLTRRLHRACLRQNRYFGDLTPALYRRYIAQFCYPRRVVLVCTAAGDSAEASHQPFPIDLHGFNPETGGCVFGIRHSNPAVEVLRRSGRAVLCEVPARYQPMLYELGKFAGKARAPAVSMSRVTEKFSIPIPDFASGWREIRVVHDEDIGAQRLFCGIVEGDVRSSGEALHHQHLVAWLAMREPYTPAMA